MSNPLKDTLDNMRARAERRRAKAEKPFEPGTLGQRMADSVATWVGSWRFVIIQSSLLVGWIVFNAVSSQRVDPYPLCCSICCSRSRPPTPRRSS